MTRRRRAILGGALGLAIAAGLAWRAGSGRSAGSAAPDPGAVPGPVAETRPGAPDNPPDDAPGAAPPPAPAVAAPGRRVPRTVAALGTQAAADYRRRARFPPSSAPLAPGDADPIVRDREISPVTAKGPNGDEPTLVVYPTQMSFESPGPVVLQAYLAVGSRRVPAREIRGTLLTEAQEPVGEFDYLDDGSGLGTATLTLPEEAAPRLSASYLVKVRAVTRGGEERLAATSFQYARPHAQLTGAYRDAVVDGSLVVGAEVEVREAGRFHLEATLYAADGGEKLVWAQTATQLEPGRHWLDLSFYGLALRERGVDGPYLVRYLALSTATEMPNAKNTLVENAHRTGAWRAAAFTDRPFGDPDLLEAADRLEGSTLPGGLEAGG